MNDASWALHSSQQTREMWVIPISQVQNKLGSLSTVIHLAKERDTAQSNTRVFAVPPNYIADDWCFVSISKRCFEIGVDIWLHKYAPS